ncbi:hypothetical protein KIH31_15425 [Paenarthrobacter sp. DKR-5]|uniref:hypothetical protein n=1 Tax=Paenarthrobacter sp. DKR-5 TaxID=2835535 RepID=UPI001BDDC5A3|nr:hypothetical protein [Paenarthrobacter sp. DKR-5]MBT1003979.1 hypothetical protein [Paenarthrobacter sp. DKR-5]
MTASNRRAGRPGKGDRRVVAFRLATPKVDIVRELAVAEGFEHVSDWLAHVVSERIDHTDLSKIKRQEELPISMAS